MRQGPAEIGVNCQGWMHVIQEALQPHGGQHAVLVGEVLGEIDQRDVLLAGNLPQDLADLGQCPQRTNIFVFGPNEIPEGLFLLT